MSSELESAESGEVLRSQEPPARKQLERLNVESGLVVVIDQFMLANPQFWAQLPKAEPTSQGGAEGWNDGVEKAARTYGGTVLRLASGGWGVYRDPLETLMLVAPLSEDSDSSELWQDRFDRDSVIGVRGNCVPLGRVFIDTRCVVFIDAALLRDRPLLEEYKASRDAGDDKGARDMIRERGAAVRYGFNREGDELGLFRPADIDCYALWPDVVELEQDDDAVDESYGEGNY